MNLLKFRYLKEKAEKLAEIMMGSTLGELSAKPTEGFLEVR